MTVERDFEVDQGALASAAELRANEVALERLQREVQESLFTLQSRLDLLETRLNQLRNEGSA
ncbi:MAG: hypothetical protein ACFB20_12695 [Opitutales bacterium]